MTISTAIDGIQLVFSYFTPIVFFCILNLMIGIIYTLHSHRKQQPPKPTQTQEEEYHQFNPHPQQPSLFQRVKSFKLSDPKPDPIHTEEEEPVIQVTRSNSETVVKKLLPPKAKGAKVLRRSASEKLLPKGEMKETEEEVERRRPETVREKTKEDEEVDGRCDDFINKFRQQLKLQRLNSFLRYKEMLNTGAER